LYLHLTIIVLELNDGKGYLNLQIEEMSMSN